MALTPLPKLLEKTQKVVNAFSIAAARPGEGISMLSGGNLQKVVVGRELSGEPAFIIANQPTRSTFHMRL